MYYRWCHSNKMTLLNPCQGLQVGQPAPKILVCSQKQYRKMCQFIKSESADPQQAMILTLILVWAMSSEELRLSKLQYSDKTLTLTLHRKKLTYKKYYNREQTLRLPGKPKWFFDLQERFYQKWSAQFDQLKKTFPHQYLLLPKSRSVRPLTKNTVLSQVFEATVSATGEKIPARVLRQTSAYLHTASHDASLLSRLGWSQDHTFKYVWQPKVTYSPSHGSYGRKKQN
jgi:hypothetical protein